MTYKTKDISTAGSALISAITVSYVILSSLREMKSPINARLM